MKSQAMLAQSFHMIQIIKVLIFHKQTILFVYFVYMLCHQLLGSHRMALRKLHILAQRHPFEVAQLVLADFEVLKGVFLESHEAYEVNIHAVVYLTLIRLSDKDYSPELGLYSSLFKKLSFSTRSNHLLLVCSSSRQPIFPLSLTLNNQITYTLFFNQ